VTEDAPVLRLAAPSVWPARTNLPVEGNEAETIVPSPEPIVCRVDPTTSRMEPVYFAFDSEGLNPGPDPSRWA
jgi:hypothetical protein